MTPVPAAFGESSSAGSTSFANLGLIDMPSARMNPDGALSVSADYFLHTQRYDLDFQALPWLNVKMEYSGLSHFSPEFPVYWDRSFGAKIRLWEESEILPTVSVGATDLVGTGLFSGEYLAASKRFGDFDTTIGVGWGSLGSTNLFRNPLTFISHSFTNRIDRLSAGGLAFGQLFHGQDVGLFGGAVWHSPIEGLSVRVEYSSNTYAYQRENGNFRPLNQMNYAVSYQLSSGTLLDFGWLYGRTVGGQISFELDPKTNSPHIGSPSFPPIPPIRTPKEQQGALNLMLSNRHSNIVQAAPSAGTLVDALWSASPQIEDISVSGKALVISVSKGDSLSICQGVAAVAGTYTLTFSAIVVRSGLSQTKCTVPKRPALALLAGSAPIDNLSFKNLSLPVQLITIDASSRGEPNLKDAIARFRSDSTRQRLTVIAVDISGAEGLIYYSNTSYWSETDALNRILRLAMTDLPSQVEQFRFIATDGSVPLREFDVLRAPAERDFEQTGSVSFANDVDSRPAPMQNPVLHIAEHYPQFDWSVWPQFRQQLFDPSNPLGFQFVGAASGLVELFPGLTLNGEVEGNIWDNFNTARGSDSVLPHVRTDFAQYFTKGKNGIGDLEADYFFRIAPSLFALAKAGYLESMFAGVGGEVLWRPDGQRWALGGDLYDVQQRNFDRLFGLQSYKALTGHISLYYASPWYGLNFLVRAGQYLAEDRGVTFQMSRRFSTGVEIGAFFTKTNVSAAQFGEGSFDKGIFLRIPLNWATPIDTQSELDTVLRPVQRDGGQELAGDAILYDITRRTSEAEIANTLATDLGN